MNRFEDDFRAVVFGASGGLGSEFVAALLGDRRCAAVFAGSRNPARRETGRLIPFGFDLQDEASIAAAAELICAEGLPHLVLVATGLLMDDRYQPEKSLRAMQSTGLERILAINVIGPALIIKHLLLRMSPKSHSVFALLSARVGSISDNHLGGWYGYRASKAALNQIIRTASIELARRDPTALCVGLHPGTVDTPLSKPFQASVPAEKLFPAQASVANLLAVIDRLEAVHNGAVIAWDGSVIPA